MIQKFIDNFYFHFHLVCRDTLGSFTVTNAPELPSFHIPSYLEIPCLWVLNMLKRNHPSGI